MSEYLKEELPEYVDLVLGDEGDENRFVDMYTIIHRNSKDEGYQFKYRIIEKVKTYFEEVLNAIRSHSDTKLEYLAKHVHEAKYTSLGYAI